MPSGLLPIDRCIEFLLKVGNGYRFRCEKEEPRNPILRMRFRLGRVKPSMNEQFKAALGAVYYEIDVLSQVSENESSSVDFDMTRLLCGLKTIPK